MRQAWLAGFILCVLPTRACMHACRETDEQRSKRLEEEAEERARAAEEADLKVPHPT